MPHSDRSAPLTDLNDDDLLAAHLAGDRRAFPELLRRHQNLLVFVADDILRDRGDAEDAVQSALLSIVRAAPAFEGRASVKNWMVRIVRNAALDARRRRLARPMLGVDAETGVVTTDPVDVAAMGEARSMVDELLWELPEVHRRIVVMIDLLDLSYETVAGILDMPVGTVKSRRSRALRALAGRLEW